MVRVAASAFNRRGYANTSLDDVASALGVTKPTLYQYFSSKQEILFHCHELSMEQGEAGLALAKAHRGPGLEKLLIYLDRYMKGFFGELGGGAIFTDVDSLTAANRKAVVDRRAKISAETNKLIALGIKDGSINSCDAKLAGLFVLGVVNWMAHWYREDGPNTPEEIISTFLALLRSSLSNKSSP